MTSARLDDDADQGTSYRQQILDGLEARDRRMQQVQRLVTNYSKLADKLAEARSSRSRTSSAIIGPKEEQLIEEIRLLKIELSDIYKSKSKNDQELIDANRRLTQTKEKLQSAVTERDQLRQESLKNKEEMRALKETVTQLRDDLSAVEVERIASAAACHSLTLKKRELESDRQQLLNKIRELNEKHAEFMNAEVALDQRRKDLKLREDLMNAANDVSRDDRHAPTRFSPDTSGDDLVGDMVPTKLKVKFAADEGEVFDVEWLGDQLFATAGCEKNVCIWRMDSNGNHVKASTLVGCNSAITRLDSNSERRIVLAASNDKTSRLWNFDSQRLLATFSGHEEKVSTARLHQTHHMISGSFDRTIKLWDLAGQKCVRNFLPGSTVFDLTSKCGTSTSSFVSGHFDKSLRFWDERQTAPLRTVVMGQRVTSLDISVDGMQLLCATRDETLSLIDMRNYATLHLYSAEQYKTISDIARCVFSTYGEYIAAGSANGCVFIWNTKTTRLEKTLRGGHESAVLSLSWNPTGRGLISCDKQKTVAYWR